LRLSDKTYTDLPLLFLLVREEAEETEERGEGEESVPLLPLSIPSIWSKKAAKVPMIIVKS